MGKYFPIGLILTLYLLITLSCKPDDLIPDEYSTEFIVSCFLTNPVEINTTKEVWVGCITKTLAYSRRIEFLGICWNFNTDSLPTRYSKNIIVKYPGDSNFESHPVNSKYYYESDPVKTGISVSGNDTKLIIRGFFIDIDSFLRYSEPLILINPIKYAQ